MNPRIRELVKQSGLDYDELWTKDQLAVDKFAELIVRDCARQVTRNSALIILEHFGVER